MWLVTTQVDHIGLTDLFATTNVITLATAPIGLGCQPARTPLSGTGEIKGSKHPFPQSWLSLPASIPRISGLTKFLMFCG